MATCCAGRADVASDTTAGVQPGGGWKALSRPASTARASAVGGREADGGAVASVTCCSGRLGAAQPGGGWKALFGSVGAVAGNGAAACVTAAEGAAGAGGVQPAGGWKAPFGSLRTDAESGPAACATLAAGAAVSGVPVPETLAAAADAGGVHPGGGSKALFGSAGRGAGAMAGVASASATTAEAGWTAAVVLADGPDGGEDGASAVGAAGIEGGAATLTVAARCGGAQPSGGWKALFGSSGRTTDAVATGCDSATATGTGGGGTAVAVVSGGVAGDIGAG